MFLKAGEQFVCLLLFRNINEKKGEKHEKHDPDIECINEAFGVRCENLFISINP